MDYLKPQNAQPLLPLLTLHEELGRGAHSVVHRATRGELTVAVKFYYGSLSSSDALATFRREAALHGSIRHPAVPEIFEVGLQEQRPYLISELIQGSTLAQRLTHGPLDEATTLRIALVLASALYEVHQHGLVHRDIKPQNIMLASQEQVRLIDFGLATHGFQEHEGHTVGTFRYSAPEQLGLLERPVDGRADFYALGMVLYECLLGQPPFLTDDLSELLHQHAAVKPPSLLIERPQLHPLFARIIQTLLEKDPDERYVSGQALVLDLERVTEQTRLEPPQVRIGQEQRVNRRGLTLIGRHAQLESLQRAFGEARQGRGCRVWLSAPAGSGKGVLCESFLQQLPDSTLILHGKCMAEDPYPLAPFREALQRYASEVRQLPSLEREAARQQLIKAAGDKASLLVQVSPLLGSLLGASAPAEDARDARDLFYNAFTHFLLELASTHRAAVLWLDDVQWLDDASAEALALLSREVERAPLLLLLTCRSEQEEPEGLKSLFLHLKGPGAVRLELGPFTQADVSSLVLHTLGAPLDETFVSWLTHHSQGNPLIIWQYLQTMKELGIVMPYWGRWTVDLEALRAIPLPDDVFALTARRIACLSPKARELLSIAALLGNHIDPMLLLAMGAASSKQELQQSLSEVLEAQLFQAQAREEGYTFIHDRVRETLLSQWSGELTPYHQRAADYLEALPDRTGRIVFEWARHCLLGYAQTQPARAARACLAAAQHAVAQHAYAQAWSLLQSPLGEALLNQQEPSAETSELLRALLPPEEHLLFYRIRGIAAFNTDRIGEAIQDFEAALERTSALLERVTLRAQIAQATIVSLNTTEGAKQLERAFEELGQPLPSAMSRDPAQLQAQLVEIMQHNLALIEQGSRPAPLTEAEVGRDKSLVSLCDTGFLVGYFNRDVLFAMQCGILALAPAFRLGTAPETCQGYAIFAWLMGVMGRGAAVRKFSTLALDLARKLDNRQVLATTQSTCAIALHLGGDADEALKLQKEVFEQLAGWLGPLAYQNCCVDLSWNYQMRGLTREDLLVSLAALRRVEHRESPFLAGYMCRASAAAMVAYALLGQNEQANHLQQRVEQYRKIVPPDRAVPWISVEAFLVRLHHTRGELGAALQRAIAAHDAWGIPPARSALHSKHFYVYHAYYLLDMCLSASPEAFPSALAALRLAVEALEATASTSTLKLHLEVLHLELLRLSGSPAPVGRYDALREQTYEQDNPWVLLKLSVSYARVLQARGLTRAALTEAQRARSIAAQLGWPLRLRRLEQEFPALSSGLHHLTVAGGKELTSSRNPGGSRRTDVLILQRQLDALLSLSRISASVLDVQQLARLALDECMRILGAERGFLFILPEEGAVLNFLLGRTASHETLTEPTAYSQTVLSAVLAKGQSVLMSTRADAQALESISVEQHQLRSILAAPLKIGERILGVIYLDNRLARGIFNADHAELLRAMGGHIAIAFQTVRSAQLEVALQAETERRRLAETLRELNASLTSTLQLEEGLERLLDALGKALVFDQSLVVLQGERGLELAVARSVADIHNKYFFQAQEVYNHLVDGTDGAILRVSDGEGHLQDWLSLPLRTRETLTGFIFLSRRNHQPFRDEDRELGLTLVGQAGIAIENARLFHRVRTLAERDGLTGLFNRREFFRQAERLYREAQQLGSRLAVIMFDVDHFKKFNDRYGHAVGDDVLRLVAQVSTQALRTSDLLGRYGGEEFVVLLPAAPVEAAMAVAERLRVAIAQSPLMTTEFGGLVVTISVGVAVRSNSEETLAQLLSEADKALYVSKQNGRNCVSLANPHTEK